MKRSLTLCIILLIFAGCATSDLVYTDMHTQSHANPAVLSWPPPPQKERIRFVRSIYGTPDLGIKKSWLNRAFDSLFGESEAEEFMLRPYGVCADSDKIYVTDPGLMLLHIFNLREKKYLQIRTVQKIDLVSPIGIAVDREGKIFISDAMLRRVFVLDSSGRYIKEIGTSDLFQRPAGIAVDEERIYIVDTHNHKIFVFSKHDGKLLFSFGKNGAQKGEFNYPTNIFMGRDKLLYITDSLNFRIQIFDRDGNFISTFGKLGDGSGNFSKPKGIAVDSEGHIYVSDAHFDTVQIFDRSGHLLLDFGKSGSGQGEMVLPAGVYIDQQDKIYVADSYNKRIEIFQYLKEEK